MEPSSKEDFSWTTFRDFICTFKKDAQCSWELFAVDLTESNDSQNGQVITIKLFQTYRGFSKNCDINELGLWVSPELLGRRESEVSAIRSHIVHPLLIEASWMGVSVRIGTYI